MKTAVKRITLKQIKSKTSCYDPMKVHSVPVKGSLRKITTVLQKSSRQRISFNLSEKKCALHAEVLKEESRILLDKSLKYLQQSPIKLHAVPQHAKESYVKRKVHELPSAAADKISNVLDVQLLTV
ncbi:hypothetical protein PR048_029796 [Dryococelus australis]|uniref:Uncharacterized protein n=1 Tax=Dryococelus australis TaxID=614101 RepID=A0ABQ9G754_9NEOP|nr:hypothetical protein PR048_029796 [Dryococelus australis]